MLYQNLSLERNRYHVLSLWMWWPLHIINPTETSLSVNNIQDWQNTKIVFYWGLILGENWIKQWIQHAFKSKSPWSNQPSIFESFAFKLGDTQKMFWTEITESVLPPFLHYFTWNYTVIFSTAWFAELDVRMCSKSSLPGLYCIAADNKKSKDWFLKWYKNRSFQYLFNTSFGDWYVLIVYNFLSFYICINHCYHNQCN